MATDERWVFGHALNVENPQVGKFERKTLYSQLTLVSGTPLQSNWVLHRTHSKCHRRLESARVMVRVVILRQMEKSTRLECATANKNITTSTEYRFPAQLGDLIVRLAASKA